MAPHNKKLTLRTCLSAHVLHDGLVDMLYALLPLLREALGLSYVEVGLIRSAHKAATTVFQIPVGMLSERISPRLLLSFGTALAGAAFLFLSFASEYTPVLAFIFLAGCGAAFQHPLSSSIISKTFPGEGQRSALGMYNAFGDIGKFIFLGLTILATAVFGFSWQTPAFGFGVIAIFIAFTTFIFFKIANTGGPPAALNKKTNNGKPSSWGIRNKRGFITLSIITALDNSTRNGFLTFVAFLMIEKSVTTEWAASAVLITLLGGMCGKYFVGLLAEKIGVARTIALTEIATSFLIICVVFTSNVYAYFFLPILGIFLNGTSSAIYGTVPDLIDPERHSRAYGLIYTLGSLCGLVAPLIYGYLSDASNISATMLTMAALLLFTVPLCKIIAVSLNEKFL